MSDESIGTYDQAQIAAIIELKFDDMKMLDADAPLDNLGLKGFTFVDMGEFDRDIYRDTYPDNIGFMKAVTLRGPDGQLYVHYNGTGDGNWGYNSAAYQDGPPSAVQEWSLNYFDRMMAEHGEGNGAYVSGHSQGGNNAQFVTMRSAYGDQIKQCISLDGPGFSNRFVEDTKDMYGEEYFESQRQKIYGYHGKSDFVSPLGQQDIIPDGHTRYLDYGNADSIVNYHTVQGLFEVDADGNILEPPRLKGLYGDGTDYSDFRKLVIAIADRIKEMPQGQQERAAEIVMKLCEGGEVIQADLTERDLTDLKEILVPLLIETAEENPELVLSALREMNMNPELVLLAEKFLREFNELSPQLRQEALDFLMEYLVVKDGSVAFEMPRLLADAWTEIRCNPANAWAIVQKYQLDDMLIAYMSEHPVASVAVVTFAACLLIFAPELVGIVVALVDILSGIVHLLDLAEDIYKFVVDMINAIKETVKKIKEWIFKNSSGYSFAQENPYIRVDTDALRGYAARLRSLNRRLVQLDHDMDHLYPQVRLKDLISAFSVNWDTSWSLAVARAASDLGTTADEFDSAEYEACRNMGG